MKLHLPVRLFRAVIALIVAAMPFSASAAQKYTVADGEQLTLSGLDELDMNISGYYVSSSGRVYGGAIYAKGSGAITLEYYVSVQINKNYAKSSSYSSYGGAIYSDSGAITLNGNESVAFSGNEADNCGGAIYSENGDITLIGNENIAFTVNYVSEASSISHGGAIYSHSGAITLSGNGSVEFSGNYVQSDFLFHGGAIFNYEGEITLSRNESVTFSGNIAARGGAIYTCDDITLSGNGSVTFSGNTAGCGGAIYSSRGDITLSGNGSVTFSGNEAYYCGAIYSSSGDITLSGNESVTFSGNYANTSSSYYDYYGGAIYGTNIYIRDNGSVIFKQNYEAYGSTYCLRGLYATGNTALSAARGNYIEFQESMYVGGVLELNNLYTNEVGKSVAQTGDIIFTGAYAAEHLGAIKSNYTAEELNNSRTSNVGGVTTLYDGRLIVRDGAILSGAGLTVASSASGYSTPTVLLENAKLNHAGATVSFASGTHLEARGQSGIGCSNLTMGSGSALTLHAAGENMSAAVLSVYGSFTMGDSITLNISFNDDKAEAGTYKLLQVTTLSNNANWTSDKITVNGLDGTTVKFEDLYWADNVLWLTYSGNIPELTVATWSNESGDGEWNTSSMNWAQDSYDYAYVDGVAVVFGDTGAGEVKLVGNLTPSSVLVDSSADYTWSGDGCICGASFLSKQGSGTLTINNANSYTGGTIINGGIIVVNNASSLGTGKVSVNGGALEIGVNDFTNAMSFAGNSGLIIGGGITYALQGALSNSGALTLTGSFNADALVPSGTIAATRVDLNGHTGASGFAQSAGFTLQVVNGGTVNDDAATITYNGTTITLDNTGKATVAGGIQHNQYHIASGHTASVSDISSKASSMGSALGNISLAAGGTLNANATANVTATGGIIKLTAGTLSGSLQNVSMTASGGAINGTFSGSSTLIGSNYAFASALQNNGTLTLTGSFNADALAPSGTIAATRVDLNGNTGASGFAQSAGFTLQVVMGGTVNDDAATITYNGTTITLDNTGKATVAGGIQYNQYHIASGHTVSVSAISSKASSMGSSLSNISLTTGGTLNANATANVTATGGTIKLSAGILSGSLQNVSMTASGGSINGTFSGSSTLTGSNYALASVLKNNGSLTLKGSFKADALSKELTGVDVRVDVNGNEGGTSGFLRTGDFTVTLANGTVNSSNASVSYKGQALSMNGGVGFGKGTVDYGNYLLTDGNSASVSDILDAANGALEDITMTGGKLTVDDSVVLDATGGNITITDDSTLSGSIVDADITTAEGEYESTIDAVIGGDSSLTMNGGTITVTGDNTYTGGTIINGGMLNIGSDTSLGAGDVTLNGGTLDLNSFAAQNNVLASGGTLSGADNFGGKLTVNGDLTLEGEATAAGGIELNGGSISGGSIVDSDILVDGEGDMEISSDITGDSSLTVNGGNLTISGGNNNYTGGTTINGGNLTIGEGGSLGSGEVTLNGGTLDTNGGEITNDIINNGGTLITSYVLSEGLTLTVGKGGMHMVGNLTLDGGKLMFQGLPLTMEGKVSGESAVNVFVSGYGVIDMDGTVTLAEFGNDVQGITNSSFVNTGYGNLSYDVANHTLNLTLTNKNIWLGGKGSVWMTGTNAGWAEYKLFEIGNRVVFNTGGSVKIVGGVEPSSVLVDVEKALTFSTSYNKKTGLYSGAINGDGCVVKRGKGMLTLNDGNEYTGGTFIEAGTVQAKGTTSFGTGAITLSGGAVDLASKAVANDIVLEGAAAVKGGKAYTGEFTMTGGELLKGSLINVADSAELQSGVVNGTLSGVGTVAVSGEVTLGATGKITTNALEIDGSLSVSAKGLAMNSKASSITIDGGTLSSAGKISAYSMNMTGGTLDVTNGKPMGITLKDAFVATAGANIDLYGGLTANQLTLEGVAFTLAMDAADIAPKVQPKAQSITLKGKGVLNTVSDSELDIAGKVSVTGDLALLDSVVMLHDVAGAAKSKAQGLTVKGALAVDASTLTNTGTISAAALSATDSIISIAAQEGLAAQSLKLTRKEIIKGTPQDSILTNCEVYVNGSMSVAGNLQLQNSDIYMRDYSGKNKAKGLSVKGDLTVGSGSMLSLTGALSAKNLTLEGGSSLTLGSAKLSTVKVSGALTLKGEVNFDLGFTVTEKDVAKEKEYTLFTFNSLVGDVSNLTLGYEGEYTLALNTKETAIVLTVKDAAAWNAYVADIQESLNAAPAVADAVATPEEEVEAEELLLKPVAATEDIEPLLAKAADTLVQSTWGTVGASRAFGETIASRGRNATLLGEEGKGAAWLSVMGGSSRISSAEGHNGADFTLSGAAFGVEGRVGEKSTLGVAIGNSWGKVSTFSAFPVDQDSMHVGIYGNHTLTKSLTMSWMATHTRTESEMTILGAPYSWSQDALQLDARLTWGKSISEKTAVSAFAGLQYLATDSGECAGLKTGSLQNLRAELGVGASHKCSDSTLVFGELSFIGDMVRNNPTAAIGDYRTHGTNPGRVGMNLSVGAQHQLSEDWSVNASYSLELMENSTSHSLNVGASYSF